MYRALLFVVLVAAASGDSEDAKKKCHRLEHGGTMRCCKSDFNLPDVKIEDFKECIEIPHTPRSCEPAICIGKKRGYASDDGTVDKEAFLKIITEDFKSMPTYLDSVKENCVKGNLEPYGSSDTCEIMKMKNCIHRQAVDGCKEWDDSGPCAGIKDLVKECAKMDN